MNTQPLVSIGLFVHNGELLLAGAISSFLNQTCGDFELILSDDGSTDRTEEICRRYAAADSRVQYYRNERQMGSAWNAGKVYSLATGKYFKWATHDDMIQPDYLRLCVDALEADDSLVLAHSFTRVIDYQGQFIENYDQRLRTNSPDPLIRIRDLLLVSHRCYPIFGLIRMDALQKLRPQQSYMHSNRVLLVRLALLGRYFEVPEFLFISTRQATRSAWMASPGQLANSAPVNRVGPPARAEWDLTKARPVTLPQWNLLKEYFLAIIRSPLHLRDRIRCSALLLPWMARQRRGMFGDLLNAVDKLLFNFQNRRTIAAHPSPPELPVDGSGHMILLELNTGGSESR